MIEKVSIREAQEAALHLGPAASDAITGPGGLSGASAEALRRLCEEARRMRDREDEESFRCGQRASWVRAEKGRASRCS